MAALGCAGADNNLGMRQLTLACHAAAVSAMLDHRWQPQVAAVPLEVLVTGVFTRRADRSRHSICPMLASGHDNAAGWIQLSVAVLLAYPRAGMQANHQKVLRGCFSQCGKSGWLGVPTEQTLRSLQVRRTAASRLSTLRRTA